MKIGFALLKLRFKFKRQFFLNFPFCNFHLKIENPLRFFLLSFFHLLLSKLCLNCDLSFLSSGEQSQERKSQKRNKLCRRCLRTKWAAICKLIPSNTGRQVGTKWSADFSRRHRAFTGFLRYKILHD